MREARRILAEKENNKMEEVEPQHKEEPATTSPDAAMDKESEGMKRP